MTARSRVRTEPVSTSRSSAICASVFWCLAVESEPSAHEPLPDASEAGADRLDVVLHVVCSPTASAGSTQYGSPINAPSGSVMPSLVWVME